MEHRRLGRTGLRVSRLCLGTMNFGLRNDEETSRAILDRAFEGGITFIDTADMYPLGGGTETSGRTEEIVGRWLNGKREDVVLATKFAAPVGVNPWDRGASRRHIVRAVEASLRRLDTDYIDLYLQHNHDPHTPVDETLAALDDLVRSGKVLYTGCSNLQAYRVARAIGRSETLGLARFDATQPRHSLLFRQLERDLLPLCEEEGLGVMPYNPLAGGLLSGRHDRAQKPSGRFDLGTAAARYRDRYWHQEMFDTVEKLAALAGEADLALPTLALAWSLAQPAITAPVIGVSDPGQLDAAFAATELSLPQDLLDRLDESTRQYRFGDSAL
ncbi:aldo/keto reductase [Nocardia sp. alder85J]|uniref:aldo/keto reductase n=1 Tax=Nocardia sp. alder85J TaxID=2862949 RepID=UPI001CD1EFFF|nr:aldo/keto reductase [Nocardia sp. alder85J]MCX4095623.1 aldo/keto reductase [Nocardia sp. alder85J]